MSASVAAQVTAGAVAVLGAAAPPVIVTATVGTGRFNDTRGVIEIDPQVLTWPAECQRFIGAHEAAHVRQKPMSRRPVIGALTVIFGLYLAALAAGAIRVGFADQLSVWAIEATCYTALSLTALLQVVTWNSRRREYRADRVAVAAVGVAGLIQWRRIAEQDLTTLQRAMLAANAAAGLRTHPSWRRRVAAAIRCSL